MTKCLSNRKTTNNDGDLLKQTDVNRTQLGDQLNISRVLTGLWQVADIEKNGDIIDPEKGADYLADYVEQGFDTFDMADHYGSAEIITGRLLKRYENSPRRPLVFTKWCPSPGAMTREIVRAGVRDRLDRLNVACIDLLQFHWWKFEHPAWLDALHELTELRNEGVIKEIGVTNFDAAHVHLAIADGVPLLTNQVSFSLLDRRAAGQMAELCRETNLRIFAYGTLCGGFLSDRWLNTDEPTKIADWSKMKYKRFIDTIGGWNAFQTVLRAAAAVAEKHGVSISNVATRWVLQQTGVAATIIGARLGENTHIQDNKKLFEFVLDDEDQALLSESFHATTPVPGDCGDEYRKPPFLTASGDLSHHLDNVPLHEATQKISIRPDGESVLSGSKWEDIAGYCRAIRVGNRVLVSGTTATAGSDRVVAAQDAEAQTVFVLDKILAALSALDLNAEHVVRTRIYIVDENDALAVSRAHGRIFGQIKPANTLIVVAGLIGGYKVEIEAEAIALND